MNQEERKGRRGRGGEEDEWIHGYGREEKEKWWTKSSKSWRCWGRVAGEGRTGDSLTWLYTCKPSWNVDVIRGVVRGSMILLLASWRAGYWFRQTLLLGNHRQIVIHTHIGAIWGYVKCVCLFYFFKTLHCCFHWPKEAVVKCHQFILHLKWILLLCFVSIVLQMTYWLNITYVYKSMTTNSRTHDALCSPWSDISTYQNDRRGCCTYELL